MKAGKKAAGEGRGRVTRIRLALAASALLGIGLTGVTVGFAGERPVEVSLSEFRIDAPKLVAVGETELVVRNSGRIAHDLVVVRTDRAADNLPVGLDGVAPQLAGEIVFGEPHSSHAHGEASAPSHHYKPGTTTSSSLTLAAGRYVLVCTLPGHYAQGQRAGLLVRRSGSSPRPNR